jgi:hypothetical protein
MMVTFLIAAIALVVAVIGCALVAPSDQGPVAGDQPGRDLIRAEHAR